MILWWILQGRFRIRHRTRLGLAQCRDRIDLRLEPRLNNIEWTSHDASQTSTRSPREELERDPDIPALFPLARPMLELLVEHELECREREVSV